ncbi:hypothetical protein ACWCQ0_26645 [Streptomyces massasporeus]|uniref:Uncharacterized protein n=1 Tax=Streptomyces massasporeus TaxID=67324 RepID=A0ABW6LMY2_9ACTN
MATTAVLLTLMLITVAGLGVLNSVVLDTRERIRDLGVCHTILVMEEGHVVERGGHDELAALGGRYATLYADLDGSGETV